MKVKLIIVAAAALAWPSLAAAGAGDPTTRPAQSAPVTATMLDAELASFGEWLVGLQRIQAPLGAELVGLAPKWAQVDPTDSASVLAFKRHIDRVADLAEQTNSHLSALSTPEFASLSLPEDLRPVSIRRDQIAINEQVKLLTAGFYPLIDGIAKADLAAAERGGLQVIKGSALLVDQQIRFARATRALSSEAESSWDFANLQLVMLRAMARMLAAFPGRAQVQLDDATLASDLSALAVEAAESGRAGARKLVAEAAGKEDEIAAAQADGAAAPLRILRRQGAILEVWKQYGPFADQLHKVLRQAGSDLKRRPVIMAALVTHMRELAQVRQSLEAIIQKENEAVAAPR
jgi:hypothetical protein